MGGTTRTNKARNQTTGDRRHVDDAAWFTKKVARDKRRADMAKKSRRKNRKKR